MTTKSDHVGEFMFLSGGGELADLIRHYDWASTPLGPIELWPQSLKTSASLMLNSLHPVWIGWGPEATFLYNDAYIQVLSAAKHPWALGKPAQVVWSEIWHVCGPLADKVFARGEPSYMNDLRLFMNRGDFIEETFYSFSYTPIRDESGSVGGLFCPSTEVSTNALNTRRLRTLSDLAAKSLVEKTTESACASAIYILDSNRDDLPFTLLYLLDAEGQTAHLAQAAGLSVNRADLCPPTVDLPSANSGTCPWPMEEAARTEQLKVVSLRSVEGLPLGLADQRLVEAVVLPVILHGQARPLGILVAGVNPARKLDGDYRTFYTLVAGQIATAIQNARVAEADRKRAEALAELDRAKTTFFSNVSHELRTPLTLILGPLEDEIRESPVSRERLEMAHRNSVRLLKLVNTLLDFSRIEAGRLEASFEPTDLPAFTAELASVFRSGMERAGLRLVVDCPPLAEPVFVDREMWEKIVFNLLSNAFKFTAKGEIEIKLVESNSGGKENPASHGEATTLAQRTVCLSVRDTGVGIPAAELPRVFDRFHRIKNGWSRSHEGTGIGLALVQELARLHGGSARAESVEGQGTTFFVSLPAGLDHLPPERVVSGRLAASASRGALSFVEESERWSDAAMGDRFPLTYAIPAPPLADSSEGTKACIVLADDNGDMREYVQRLLTGAGYDVIAVADGQAALEAVRAKAPALILSDVMMPRLDGFGLLHELRKHPATKGIPIILLSARAGGESVVEGVAAGADDYLTKPFSARELLARVSTLLKLTGIRKEAEEIVRDANSRLEALVLQRTLKLRETITELEAFSYSIAHDMRAPLRSLQGFSEILLTDYADKVDADGRRFLQRIATSAGRMDKLIQDVLNYSRIVRGDLPLERVDIDQLLHGIIDTYPALMADKADVSLEGPFPAVLGNEAMLMQIFSNLMGNGVKFVPSGTRPRLRVWSEVEGPHVRLFVHDNGIGIAADQYDKIFGVFQQVNREFEGTGIGLAIVKKAVERLGGKVGLQSEPGRGSTFWVEMPVA